MKPSPEPPRTVPTKVAALAVNVSEPTIRQWARRGKLTRYGTPGRAEYDINELIRLAEDRAAKGRGVVRE